MNQKLGGKALGRDCYVTFYHPGPAGSAGVEILSLPPSGDESFIAAVPLGLPSSYILSAALLLSPSPFYLVSCSCLFLDPVCGKEEGILVTLSLSN